MMNKALILLLLAPVSALYAQTPKSPPTLRSILLEQLKTIHNQKDWFVPASVAVEGVTAEQAEWKDKSGNHSIRELVSHLIFWNERALDQFQGEKLPAFDGNNEETFIKNAQGMSWSAEMQRLDAVLTGWEKAVEAAPDDKLNKWASTIAHIGTHNAYHIGEIVYIRRQQGSWDPEKGVKS
jgi:uncharacterized damage-inducible protein DinB